MYVRITFVFLIVSMIGCGALKERFGTVEETPELESARTECRFLADKDTSAKDQGIFKKMDSTRAVYDDCMKNKGYSKGGRKVN
jgi:hypothetical protein